LLSPPPRDFAAGRYKFRSTPTGTLPTVQDVADTIAGGLRGTSMPGYRELLTAEQIAGLARHVLAMAPPSARPGTAVTLPAVATPASAAAGARLYEQLGCGECHGADPRAHRRTGVRERASARLDGHERSGRALRRVP
jgi:mono/diheme cytochrome c family protein